MYNLASTFIEYLSEDGLSKNSLRFYKSDLNHFTAWVTLKIKSLGIFTEDLKEIIPFLKHEVAFEYKEYLSQNGIAIKTINRRLATLRRFSQFILKEGLISFDFTERLENVPSTIVKINLPSDTPKTILNLASDFEKFLEGQKASKSTVKNYTADVKHFLNWIDQNYAA